MEDLNILQWKFLSSSNTRKSLRLLGRRSNFMKNINNTQPPCWEGRRLFRQGNMIPEIIFNIRFGKVCSSSPCFLPGQEPHYPSSTLPHLFRNNIFTSYYFVSKSKYSEILKSFCARVSLSSLPNSNFFMFVWAVDRAESIDPDGVIHNPKGRKLDRVSVMNEIICKAKGI